MAMIQLPKSVMDDILKQDKQLNAKLGQVELTNTLQVTLALLFPLILTACTNAGTVHDRDLAS